MRDVDPDTDGETAYECFECGTIVEVAENPVTCPACRGPMRNRQTPLE